MKRIASIRPFVTLSPSSRTPLNVQLYRQYRDAILKGELSGGDRLPASRALAKALGVSRNTVLAAFDQLMADGFVEGLPSSGTFVSRFSNPLPQDTEETSLRSPEALRLPDSVSDATSLPQMEGRIVRPFLTGVPALDLFPAKLWARLVSNAARHSSPKDLDYGDSMGHPALRSAIAEYLRLSRGLNCDEAQILIVAGSQQGLALTARTLIAPGQQVFIEDPQYFGARHCFLSAGAQLLPLDVDQEGVTIPASSRGGTPRIIYVTPSHQFPLGVTMSLSRRLDLLRYALDNHTWIIEDDYDSDFRYLGKSVFSLQALDRHGNVIYIGSFSKSMFPSLRLGYVVLPPELVPVFRASRQVNDFCPPYLAQVTMAEFMTQGHFTQHLQKMTEVYKKRQLLLRQELTEAFGSTVGISNIQAGLNLVLWLPEQLDDVRISSNAAARGVSSTPMSSFYLRDDRKRSGLFLGFGVVTRENVADAVSILAKVVAAELERCSTSGSA